ncbi:MAG: hypothetical protein K8T89_07555 [Planctomycetes bacterium]|nr:hypothetical protein [Planctomycetota bacterium]
MWKWTLGLAIVACLLVGWSQFGQTREQANAPADKKKEGTPKPDKKTVKELMTRKLDHSQKLLAALIKNDLPKAAAETEALIRVRKEAAWMIVKTDTYEMWSKDFTQNAEDLIKAAKDKNLDAAKLRYLELTLTCFHCHAYVRDLGDISYPSFEE